MAESRSKGLFKPVVDPVEAVYFDGSIESGNEVVAWLRKRAAAAAYIEPLMPGQVKRAVADMPTGFGPMVVFLYNRVGYTKHPEQVFVSPGVWIVRKGRESRFETWGNDAFEENFEYAGHVPNSVIEENMKVYADELARPFRGDLSKDQLADAEEIVFICSRCNHTNRNHEEAVPGSPCMVANCPCARLA